MPQTTLHRTDVGAVGAAPAALRVRGLRKAFGRTRVLEDVDLDVPAGAIVALLGPSGGGKTTLLRCVAGLERPDAGEVTVDGHVLTGAGVEVPPERRRLGMVFQDGALFPHLTVAANVAYGLRRDQRRGERVEAALALVALDGLGGRMPSSLSGGQQQRVALARALVMRPSLLLLDEPFSNLDSGLRVQIRGDVQGLLAELGVTAVFVTHDQEEAFVVGDQVAVLLDGRLVQQATPAELYRVPASRAVAEFVGDANLVPGQADGDRAHTAIGPVPLAAPLRGQVDVLLRPEDVRVAAGAQATVEAVEYYGHDAVLVIRPGAGERLRARVLAVPRFGAGDTVSFAYVGKPTVGFPRGSG
jgi:iron(III) transport system ATP-binding protein